ncbi:hypothetical protein GCM10010172_24620 [Paractinoplanes ferrugineus]|uniref:Uncharacterized protein n=2 Tax=Paractinoplanes ferrugineus TaxID=113564 RepID=A0A919MI07_9ACTN|nr:hypothetical protein Afe05nite_04670 [Actinoplanes ferrugineus]
MTAAGLALIAGGLATLISFRAVLFGGANRHAQRDPEAIEAPRPRPALAPEPVPVSGLVHVFEPAPVLEPVHAYEPAPVPDELPEPEFVEVAEQLPVEGEPARSRRARRAARRTVVSRPGGRTKAYGVADSSDEDEHGGLASLGFAADPDDAEFDPAPVENELFPEPPARRRRGRRSRFDQDDEALYAPSARHSGEPRFEDIDRVALFDAPPRRGEREVFGGLDRPLPAEDSDLCAEADRATRPPRPDRYGDRVEGWVRPEYQEPANEPRAGEYWTPIPVDLNPDPEPSAQGYGWPLLVERLPAVPDYEPATGFDLNPVPAEPTEFVSVWPMNEDRRSRPPSTWPMRNQKFEDPAERHRPRPRPRPTISSIDSAPGPDTEPPADPSTRYVSRHAADPPHR